MLIHQEYVHINENFYKLFIGRKDFDSFRKLIFDFFSLRKVKLDQRKLTDNVNAVSDIARVRKLI
jgi:hypothetical protein